MPVNRFCHSARTFDPGHPTCRSCPISCSQRLAGRQKQHKSKYGAEKTLVDGIVFASKKEAAHYQKLKMMERAGVISNLELQPRFELIPKVGKDRAVHYVADFRYQDENGETVIVDVKGMATPAYRLKKRMMKHFHDIDVVEV